ncbi:hypothetical protein [Kitasatospora sp. NPDC059599]|uniref:hypothetical protein n=1 Tax=Kitasatospora sp. NPDC059599 TaxID=3346880 RepID=UPI0036B3C4BD
MKWKLGQRVMRAAVVGTMAASGLLLANAPSAIAAESPAWAAQIGPSGSGCFVYTTYTNNIVTAHIWQQEGNRTDRCGLQVLHYGQDSSGTDQYRNWWPSSNSVAYTSGAATVVDGPDWYYGPWTSGKMCVSILAFDEVYLPPYIALSKNVCPW